MPSDERSVDRKTALRALMGEEMVSLTLDQISAQNLPAQRQAARARDIYVCDRDPNPPAGDKCIHIVA